MHVKKKSCIPFNSVSFMRSNEECARCITKGKGRGILLCTMFILLTSLFILSCFSGCAAKFQRCLKWILQKPTLRNDLKLFHMIVRLFHFRILLLGI